MAEVLQSPMGATLALTCLPKSLLMKTDEANHKTGHNANADDEENTLAEPQGELATQEARQLLV